MDAQKSALYARIQRVSCVLERNRVWSDTERSRILFWLSEVCGLMIVPGMIDMIECRRKREYEPRDECESCRCHEASEGKWGAEREYRESDCEGMIYQTIKRE